MSTFQRTLFLQNPLEEGVWLRGKIVVIKNKKDKYFKYFIDGDKDIFVMSAKKTGRKEYLIYSDDLYMHKIGKISNNFIGNNFKVSITHSGTMNSNSSSKFSNSSNNKKNQTCSIKYVSKVNNLFFFNIVH